MADAIDDFNDDLDSSDQTIPPRLVHAVMEDPRAKHKDLRRKFGPIEVCAIYWDRNHPGVEGAIKRQLIGELIDEYMAVIGGDTSPVEDDPGAW